MYTVREAPRKLLSLFPRSNFMTPSILGFGWLDEGETIGYELSTGEGFDRGTVLYGVSVRPDDWVDLEDKKSQCFFSLQDARAYIESLKGGDV